MHITMKLSALSEKLYTINLTYQIWLLNKQLTSLTVGFSWIQR